MTVCLKPDSCFYLFLFVLLFCSCEAVAQEIKLVVCTERLEPLLFQPTCQSVLGQDDR